MDGTLLNGKPGPTTAGLVWCGFWLSHLCPKQTTPYSADPWKSCIGQLGVWLLKAALGFWEISLD